MINFRQYVTSLKEFANKKYSEYQIYQGTIKGKLKIRLLIVIIFSYLISIIVLLEYLARANSIKSQGFKELKSNQNEDFVTLNAIHQDLDQMMLNNYRQLVQISLVLQTIEIAVSIIMKIILKYSNQWLTNIKDPCMKENITKCAINEPVKLVQNYKSYLNIEEPIYLATSFYSMYGTIQTENFYQHTQIIQQLDPYIIEFNKFYDNQINMFETFFIINENDQIFHQFPVAEQFQTEVIIANYTKKKTKIIIQDSFISLNTPFKLENKIQGNIFGRLNFSLFQIYTMKVNFVKYFFSKYTSNLQLSIIDNLAQLDLLNNFKNFKDCQCQILAVISQNLNGNQCQINQLYEGFFRTEECGDIFIKQLFNSDQYDIKTNTQIYLVGKSLLLNKESDFWYALSILWVFLIFFFFILFINFFIVNQYVNVFTRDITNPIRQITLKLSKILQNVFIPKMLNKIQGDDILIKEETEVHEIANDFSQLFRQLKEENVFSNEIIANIDQTYSKSKEIQTRQPDKTIDQIRQIVQKFGKEN